MSNKHTKSDLSYHSQSIINQQSSFGNLNNNKNENFKFISEDYSKFLKCMLCKQLMIRPMRFHPCGHTFCLKCIEPLMQVSKKVCPILSCSQKCIKIQNDRTAQSLIDELKVQCTNEGCVWKGEYDTYKKSHKDTCILKNGGLGKWLSQLRGINIRARPSLDEDEEKQQQHERNISRSQHLLRDTEIHNQEEQIERHQHRDKIQEQQNAEYHESRQIKVQNHEIYKQKQERLIELQRNSVQNKSQSDKVQQKQNKLENRDYPLIKNQIQQTQNILNPQPLANTLSNQDTSRRIRNNALISNIPFGPSLDQQIRNVERKKLNFIKKELKKLQS